MITFSSRDKDGCTPNVRVLMVFSWCSTLGFLGMKKPINTHFCYRAYIGISHRGTLVGVHPTIPGNIAMPSPLQETRPDEGTR